MALETTSVRFLATSSGTSSLANFPHHQPSLWSLQGALQCPPRPPSELTRLVLPSWRYPILGLWLSIFAVSRFLSGGGAVEDSASADSPAATVAAAAMDVSRM